MEIKEYTKFKADEILQLYTQVGWTAYTEDMPALERGYKNSLLILAAYENGELLGIVRVVGDGTTIVLVQDILVYPARQRQGIGTALLKAVLERYKNVRQVHIGLVRAKHTDRYTHLLQSRESGVVDKVPMLRHLA